MVMGFPPSLLRDFFLRAAETGALFLLRQTPSIILEDLKSDSYAGSDIVA